MADETPKVATFSLEQPIPPKVQDTKETDPTLAMEAVVPAEIKTENVTSSEPEKKVEQPKVEVVEVIPEPVKEKEPEKKVEESPKRTDTATPIVDAVKKMNSQSTSKGPLILAVMAALFVGGMFLVNNGYLSHLPNIIKDSVISKKVEDFKELGKSKLDSFRKKAHDELEDSVLGNRKPQPKILEARDYYIRLLNDDQSVTVRTGGSRSWRLGNACSILWGTFAKNNEALGKVDKYAVWQKVPRGRKACYDLLFESDHGYKEKRISDAVKRFAPPKDGFKPEKYLKALQKNRFNLNTIMKDLSESQRYKLIDILVDVEDFSPGRTQNYSSIEDFEERGY